MPPTPHPQGNRKVIDGMAPGSAKVLETVLKLVDSYDLYGRCVCVCVCARAFVGPCACVNRCR